MSTDTEFETEDEPMARSKTAADHEVDRERRRKIVKTETDARLDAPTVYEVIAHDGIEEMERPLTSLWWSGVAAGFGISVSLYMMAAIRVSLDGAPGAGTLEKFGYCFGFLIVVLGRLQLFTENTITPILPLLRDRTAANLKCVLRLWGIVLIANFVGTFCAAALPVYLPITSPEQNVAILDISVHFADRPMVNVFFSALPAGFLVAAMVWMLPTSKGFEFWTILLMTFAIAVADTSHVVVGSAEIFTAILQGESGVGEGFARIGLAGLGNIIGGSGLFALLAYGQVSEEI